MLNNIKDKIKKFLDNEKISDLINTFKFILLHGIMGLFVTLSLISIIGIDFAIVEYIRNSVLLSIIVFLIGSGASYYLLMDISDFYNNMRKNKR